MTDRNRWIALYVLCAGMLMIVLDVTVVNVALPSIQDDLGFSQSSLAWVVNAYLIAFGGLLLLAGRLGDLLGRRTSSWPASPCSPSPRCSAAWRRARTCWSAPRFVQGIGGAMTSAVILGMIVTMFPEPREQAKAIGVYGFVAVGRRLGRPARRRRAHPGDQLALDLLHQHPDRDRHRRCWPRGCSSATRASAWATGADIPGAVLITSALMLGVYTIVKPAAEDGWGSAGRCSSARSRSRCSPRSSPARRRRATRWCRCGSSARATCRARTWSRRSRSPACSACSSSARSTCSGCSATTRSRSASRSCPCTLVMGTLSLRYSERLIMRFGATNVLIPGWCCVVVGLAAVRPRARRRHATCVDVLPAMLLLGARRRASLPGADDAGDVRRDARGRRPGVRAGQHRPPRSAARSASRSSPRCRPPAPTTCWPPGSPQAAALTSGYHLAFLIGAALVVVGIVVAALVIEPVKQPQAAHGPEPERRGRARPPRAALLGRALGRAPPRSGGGALEQHVIAPDPCDLEVPGRDPDPHEAVLLDHSLRAVVVEQGARLDAM